MLVNLGGQGVGMSSSCTIAIVESLTIIGNCWRNITLARETSGFIFCETRTNRNSAFSVFVSVTLLGT